MKRTFCDRCKKEITEHYTYGELTISEYGSCPLTRRKDLCEKCLEKVKKVLQKTDDEDWTDWASLESTQLPSDVRAAIEQLLSECKKSKLKFKNGKTAVYWHIIHILEKHTGEQNEAVRDSE